MLTLRVGKIMTRKLFIRLLAALTVLAAGSCSVGEDFGFSPGEEASGKSSSGSTRAPSEENRHVFIMYAAAYNDLQGYIVPDMRDLRSGYIPGDTRDDDVLLVFSKESVSDYDFATKVNPVLYRLSKDSEGTVTADTLKVWPDTVLAASAETLHDVLTEVKDRFYAKSYGLVFSSHASGWVPPLYYYNPSLFESKSPISARSIGMDVVENNRYEIDLKDFAKAIPMHLDYILFDACLMGCVEVAYELKDVTDVVGFSQTEVMAEGFDYLTISSRLVGDGNPDPIGVCVDYFAQYDSPDQKDPYATVSAVDCRKLDNLAAVCKDLISRYRNLLDTVDPGRVQRYYRGSRHFFYDLRDIFQKANVPDEDLSALDAAIDASILYRAHTDYFLTIPITTFSGYSMYLPADGTAYLDNYYTTLAWNKAVELVK